MTIRLGVDLDALRRDLGAAVDGEVRFDEGALAAFSTDGSNYRQVPLGVVVPRTPDAAAAAVAVCHRHRAPVLSRGGGTSLAGQCTNTAVVLDWSKYCDRLESVDVERRTCVVQPGIVLDVLDARLARHGLRFGPEPSTHPNCTIGGMIGNNSCGATAQAFGKTVDNVRRLEVVTHAGDRFWVGPTDDPALPELSWDAVQAAGGRRAEIYRGLRELARLYAGQVRERYPRIPRRVSGYDLDSLLGPDGAAGPPMNVARALVGSEGTCVTVLRAELDLVEVPRAHTLVVLGYPDVAAAADSVPAVLPHRPFKLEGVDERLVDLERTSGLHADALGRLPAGGAWLFVGLTADDEDAARAAAHRLVDDLRPEPETVALVEDAGHARTLWAVREGGLGATARPGGPAETAPDCWPGWEDSAVDPYRLGDYLRDLHDLLDRFGYRDVSVYGHFGQGCVHCRIPFDLVTRPGIDTFSAFLDAAADLVVRYGGSLSGEHGDGRARGPLLEKMFGADLVTAMRAFRALWDPDGLMNPGQVVDAGSPVDGLRLGTSWSPATPSAAGGTRGSGGRDSTVFAYPDDDGSFQRAVLRCVGVGKCHSPQTDGRVMCPSYRATRDEEHSTRGRSRLLFEMLDGHEDATVRDGWRSTAVRDALDLCLACKGCLSDCPMHVDMATYKAEFLSRHYAGRLRPRSHYAMGWLPVWARLAALAPGIVDVAAHAPVLAGLAKAAAGVDPRRDLPAFPAVRFTTAWRHRQRGRTGQGPARPDAAPRGRVVLWPDTFSNHLHPHVAAAAATVLEAAGFDVVVPDGELCCGLTWISTGQLGIARRVLRRTAHRLARWTAAGVPVVGLEPSCTAVFRADSRGLLPFDRDVERLRGLTTTLPELLVDRARDWLETLPDPLRGKGPPGARRRAVVQRHCHQHAVLPGDADTEVLARAGVDAEVLDAGCCGLAGNFGFERGHYEVSMACAEDGYLPAVRAADAGTLVVADGFSCRTQLEQSDVDRTAVHVAEVLAARLRPPAGGPRNGARAHTDDRPRVGAGRRRHANGAAPVPPARPTAWEV